MIQISETNEKEVKNFKEKEWRDIDVEHYGKPIIWIEKAYTYKAEIDGKIVGVISGTYEAEILYIKNLIVASNQRGSGIGKALMKKAEEFGKKNGAIKAHLSTGRSWKAQKFYKSLGYKQIAVYPKQHFGVDFIIYQKPL